LKPRELTKSGLKRRFIKRVRQKVEGRRQGLEGLAGFGHSGFS